VMQLAEQLGMDGDELIDRLLTEGCHCALHLDDGEAQVIARIHRLFPIVVAGHTTEHAHLAKEMKAHVN
jgi:hypothetical protein